MNEALIEKTLIDIWKELLKVPNVGPDDHFLDLGGDSMLALRLRARIYDAFALELSSEAMFECSTVRELVAAIATSQKSLH